MRLHRSPWLVSERGRLIMTPETHSADELLAQLRKLREARISGVRRVEFDAGNGVRKSVEYKSDDEIAAAILDLERRLREKVSPSRIHTVKLSTSKGL